MEVWISVTEEELLQQPELYKWLLEIQKTNLPGHEFVFDFDSGSYKIRPQNPRARHQMETLKSLTGFGVKDG